MRGCFPWSRGVREQREALRLQARAPGIAGHGDNGVGQTRHETHDQHGMVPLFKSAKRYSSYKGELTRAPENLVNRDFHADGPNMLRVTDLTEFSIPAGKAYLSPLIDCYDGLPVA